MVDLLQSLCDFINASNIGVNVQLAYSKEFQKRPVTASAAYITFDKLRGSAVDFTIHVYSPVSESGRGCIKAAQAVFGALLGDTQGFSVGSLSISGVEYNNDSVAFTAKISGMVSGSSEGSFSLGGYIATAFDFANNAELSVDIFAENISVLCDCSPYPIMTICSGKAIDISEGDKSYSVTLKGVSQRLANILCSNGTFTLRLARGTMVEDYLKCSCKGAEINTDSDSEKSYLTVISYDKITRSVEEEESGEVSENE